MGRKGLFHGQSDLSDWKTFDGVTLPVKRVNSQDGKDATTVTFTEVHLNPEVDPKLFDRPVAKPQP